MDLEPYLSLGTFLTYTFGAPQSWGWGVEARVGGADGSLEEMVCGVVETRPFFYTAGALRVEWFPTSHTRLLAVGLAGHTFESAFGAHGELGLGYRFGEKDGLDSVIGAELDASIAALAVHHELQRAELGLALGLFYPTPTVNSVGCVSVGRPLRCDEGVAQLPVLVRGARTADVTKLEAPPEATRIWGRRAQTEWASIPAFCELAAQLRALHAPQDLAVRARDAARDELRHAVLAAAHAATFGGRAVEIGYAHASSRPLVLGTAGLARTAVESWLDGCLGEGVAAACAAEEARLAATPELGRTQDIIAADEHRHAELAWDVLEWALDAGGDEVRRALHAVVAADAGRSAERASDEPLEAFGVLGSERQQAVASAQQARGLERLDALLAR